MKECNQCLISKAVSEYGVDKRNKDGLQGKCNDCCNENRRLKYKTDPQHRNNLKNRQKKYNGYALEKGKRHALEISDTYVIAALKRGTKLTTEDIRKHPVLIEAKRQVIKNQRLCR